MGRINRDQSALQNCDKFDLRFLKYSLLNFVRIMHKVALQPIIFEQC